MATRYIEKRKRGLFGWIFLLVFLLWNFVMAILVFGLISRSEVDAAGTMAFVFLLVIWALGAVITGLLAILTRGGKTVIERR